MPQVRLPFIPSGALNTANSPGQTGQQEPITGLNLPSGLSPGAWFDMTESEAQAYSNTTVGTLHAGRYQWVQLSSTAVIAGNGALQRGQALFAVPSSALPPAYVVTNVPPAAAAAAQPGIGVFLNTAPGGTFPVTPGNWFFMQVIAPGRATVKMRAAITNAAPAVGDPISVALVGPGVADSGLFDDVVPPASLTASAEVLASFVGSAEAAPANGALVIVDIRVPGPSVI
jgi:hypothetical protein